MVARSAAVAHKATGTWGPTRDSPGAKDGAPVRLLRDRFTIPQDEHDWLGALKRRAIALGHPMRKSEVLRAGIKALAALPDKAFLEAAANVQPTKAKRSKGKKHG